MTALGMSSTDFVPPKGFGLRLYLSMKARISASGCLAEEWMSRCSLLVRRFGEPAPDLIGPGGRGRCEVGMVGSIVSPAIPRWRWILGGGVAAHDDVDVRSLENVGIGLLKEIRKLLGPVAPAALADDEAGSKIKGGKRRDRPVKLAVMDPPFGNARPHRRHGLRAVGRPYPGSLRRRTASAPVRRSRMQAPRCRGPCP